MEKFEVLNLFKKGTPREKDQMKQRIATLNQKSENLQESKEILKGRNGALSR